MVGRPHQCAPLSGSLGLLAGAGEGPIEVIAHERPDSRDTAEK